MLAEVFAVVALGIVLLLIPAIGLIKLKCLKWAKKNAAFYETSSVRLRIILIGWGLASFGILCVIGTFAFFAIALAAGHFEGELAILGLLVTLAGTFIAASGFLLLVLSSTAEKASGFDHSSLRDESLSEDERQELSAVFNRLERFTGIVRILSWTFILFPLALILLPGLFTFVLPMFFVATLVLILGSQRRGQQAYLLWILAISSRQNRDLADEVEAFARTRLWWNRFRTLELAERLREGVQLSKALEQLPGLVPKSAALAIGVAEKNGDVEKALRDSATHYTKNVELSSLISSVSWFSMYYTTLLTATGFLVTFQLYYIVPKFLRIFQDFGVEIPSSTQALLDVGNFFFDYIFLFLPILAIPAAIVLGLWIGYYQGWSNLRLGWLVKLYPRGDTAWLLRHMANTVDSGHTLTASLNVISLRHHRPDIARRIQRIADYVESGTSCWQQFRSERLITKHEEALLESAERASNLPWALRQVADNVEQRRDHRLYASFETVRPFVVAGVAALVAFVCLSMFMPIIELINKNLT